MIIADNFSDRRAFSTDNNEYAYGLNDENEWEENIRDDDVPLDDEVSDFLENPDEPERLYNETGYDPEILR